MRAATQVCRATTCSGFFLREGVYLLPRTVSAETRRLWVTVAANTHRAVREAAARRRVSAAEFVRRAIQHELARTGAADVLDQFAQALDDRLALHLQHVRNEVHRGAVQAARAAELALMILGALDLPEEDIRHLNGEAIKLANRLIPRQRDAPPPRADEAKGSGNGRRPLWANESPPSG